MNIGTVINLPVGSNDTSCIVVNKKTFGEIRREFIDGSVQFLDHVSNEHDDYKGKLYIFTFSKLYFVSINDDASLCYELLVGDKKVWIRQHLLNKYKVLKIEIWI